ncbi:MAG: antibiotic biosynthesis monooxygenase [Sphingomonadaceae bacterium]|nr:antibiotic biosynthesis monooxygenase [Sphingomonadaceae bacterium]
MDLELCIFEAKDGNAPGLVKAVNEGGGAALASCEGCRKVTAYAGVENPGSALLLVEWDSVEAHEAAKTAEGFAKFVET